MSAPFVTHRSAALALLTGVDSLQQKQAQFLGGITAIDALSEKQRTWLDSLLRRHRLPPLIGGDV